MKLVCVLFILSPSFLISMERVPFSEQKQRTNKTVSGQNRLTRSTSGKLERVGQTIKKSTSLTALSKLANATVKSHDASSKEEIHLSKSSKAKKLQFESLFIDKALLSLTTSFDEQAETALQDGDVKKFQEAYKQIESPRAKQSILSKAEKLRGLDSDFCHILVLLSNH